MFERYKKYWMRNFAKSVVNRRGLRAWKFLLFAFVANMGFILAWFAPLLLVTKFAVIFDLVSAQTAVQVVVPVMQLFALIHLVYFSLTKHGDRMITSVATKIESFLFPRKTKNKQKKYISVRQTFTSHIPPVPCAPPRAHLA